MLALVFSVQAQRTQLSPSAAIKALEINEGKSVGKDIHAFVILSEGVDLKALDTAKRAKRLLSANNL